MPHSGDFHDNGLRYVDAVNGIMDGFNNKIARKGSTSTQNSDYSGNEGVDINPMEIKSNPLGISMMKSGSPQTISSPQSEIEFERTVPVTLAQQQQQFGYDYQQALLGIPPHSSQMQAYLDPNRPDYRHQHGQMRFPNAQFGSAFTQQQIRDTNVGVSPHHYVSQVHMTMAHTSHVAMRPTVQPLVQQPQQTHYSDENTYGKRFIQLPMDPSYNTYQPQYPPAVIGGNYTLHPVCPQQVAFSDKIQRLDDCLMCQKALPHAHSDPLVQNQKDSGVCVVPDSHSIHQSLVNSPVAHQVGLQQPENLMFFQNPIPQENVRTTVRRINNGMMGVPGFPAVTPTQSRQEDSVNQYSVPSQYQRGNEEALQSKLVNSPHYVGVVQAPERSGHLSSQSPVEFYGMLPGVCSKGHAVESCISSGQLSPIDGMMESLWITHPEISSNTEQNPSFVDKTREQISNNRSQLMPERNVHLDATYKQTEVMPASLEASYAYNSQQMGSYPQSQIGTETVYVVDRTSHVQWPNGGIQLQPTVGSTDIETASDSKSSFLSSGGAEDVQASSNSLFSNQDPWNLGHTTRVPPKPNKILTKKEDFDPFSGNNSSNGGESVTDGIFMDVINQPLKNSKDFDSEQVQSSQGRKLLICCACDCFFQLDKLKI